MKQADDDTHVRYLCEAPEGDGLVFADELPEHYYAPGCFFVEETVTGGFADHYSFVAQHGPNTLALTLVKSDRPGIFTVDAGPFGIFEFRAVRLVPPVRYAGNRHHLFNGQPLWCLAPADPNQLEQVCLAQDFYFVGA